MKIAFVTEVDPKDIRSWSGTPYYMAQAYEQIFDEVQFIQTPSYDHLDGTVEERLKQIGAFVSYRLQPVDAVVCQGNSAIPFMDSPVPVAYWHDSTWFALSGTDFRTFSKNSPELRRWDEMALQKSDLIVFASHWAARTAFAHYPVPPSKVHVLPFGANIDGPRTEEDIEQSLSLRAGATCKLTFLGSDWKRKGLARAVELASRLTAGGMDVKLTIIGCSPAEPFIQRASFVVMEGFLRKTQSADARRLARILSETHFLVHPASFECFGVALAEANAFGVPVIATDVTGIPTVVRDGVNGKLFTVGKFVEQAAAFIQKVFARDRYRRLALSSFNEYKTRLNWIRSGSKFKSLLLELVNHGRTL